MQLTHLETFLALAEDGSLRRTAAQLQTHPTAICTSVREFEASLGLRLFIRSLDSFELTVAGRALIERADEALEALERLADEADEQAS